MKTLSTFAVAILFGLSGAAMAGDSGEMHQDNTNAGYANSLNPYMPPHFSTPAPKGRSSFAKSSVEHHAVKHRVKK
jgi:hypothetical protein